MHDEISWLDKKIKNKQTYRGIVFLIFHSHTLCSMLGVRTRPLLLFPVLQPLVDSEKADVYGLFGCAAVRPRATRKQPPPLVRNCVRPIGEMVPSKSKSCLGFLLFFISCNLQVAKLLRICPPPPNPHLRTPPPFFLPRPCPVLRLFFSCLESFFCSPPQPDPSIAAKTANVAVRNIKIFFLKKKKTSVFLEILDLLDALTTRTIQTGKKPYKRFFLGGGMEWSEPCLWVRMGALGKKEEDLFDVMRVPTTLMSDPDLDLMTGKERGRQKISVIYFFCVQLTNPSSPLFYLFFSS